jgi:hypothetical protein
MLIILLRPLRRCPFQKFPKILTLLLIKQTTSTLQLLLLFRLCCHLPSMRRLLMSEVSEKHITRWRLLLSFGCREYLLPWFGWHHEVVLRGQLGWGVEYLLGLVVGHRVSRLGHRGEIYWIILLICLECLYRVGQVLETTSFVIFGVPESHYLGIRVLMRFLNLPLTWSYRPLLIATTTTPVLGFRLHHYVTTSRKYRLRFFRWLSIPSLVINTSKLHYLLLTIDTLNKQLLLLTHNLDGLILDGGCSLTRLFHGGGIL